MWLSLITAICLQVAPGAKVPIEKCEAYYKACVEQLVAIPGSKEKGLDHDKVAGALLQVPSARNTLCTKVIQ